MRRALYSRGFAFGIALSLAACSGTVVDDDPFGPAPKKKRSATTSPGAGDPNVPGGAATTAGDPTRPGSSSATEAGKPSDPSKPGAIPGNPAANPSNPSLPTSSACKNNVPGPRALRRLTGEQYHNTLRDLFGSASVPPADFLIDTEVRGFRIDAAALVLQDLGAQQLADHADAVAKWAASNKLAQLSPCQTADSACKQQFIRKFGRRVFRAPVTDAQVKAYDALAASEASFGDSAEVIISAMLQSPHFIYRKELGVENSKPDQLTLTAHEVASEISYLLTDSMPDDTLSAAADAGMLSTPVQIDAHVDRLLKDSKSHDTAMAFWTALLGLEHLFVSVKDDSVFKLTDSLKKDMMAETRASILDNLKKGASIGELFTADYSFLNKSLLTHYAMPGAGSAELVKTPLMPAVRDVGILAQGSLLTAHATAQTSSPVRRGKMVRTRLLCQPLPDPPGDVDTMLKVAVGTKTTRERFARHSEDPACAGCHRLMDPIGYGFEAYDAFGRKRDKENGVTVDTRGIVAGVKEGEFAFTGINELGNYLGKSSEVKECVARTWSYVAFGISEWEQDACTHDVIRDEAARGQFSMKSILMAIAHAPHFTTRVRDR